MKKIVKKSIGCVLVIITVVFFLAILSRIPILVIIAILLFLIFLNGIKV